MSLQPYVKHRLSELDNANGQLVKEVEGLENALKLHSELQMLDKTSVRGLLREEIGGSRWQHGGEGKVLRYTGATDLTVASTGNQEVSKARGARKKPTSASVTSKQAKGDPKRQTCRASREVGSKDGRHGAGTVARRQLELEPQVHAVGACSNSGTGRSRTPHRAGRLPSRASGANGGPQVPPDEPSHGHMDGERTEVSLNSTYTVDPMKAIVSQVVADSTGDQAARDVGKRGSTRRKPDNRVKFLKKMITKLDLDHKLKEFKEDELVAIGMPSPVGNHGNCDPDVYIWLRSLALRNTDKYAAIFGRYEIDVDSLQLLTETQLRAMGVEELRPLNKMLTAIEQLGAAVLAAEAASPARRAGLPRRQASQDQDAPIIIADSGAESYTESQLHPAYSLAQSNINDVRRQIGGRIHVSSTAGSTANQRATSARTPSARPASAKGTPSARPASDKGIPSARPASDKATHSARPASAKGTPSARTASGKATQSARPASAKATPSACPASGKATQSARPASAKAAPGARPANGKATPSARPVSAKATPSARPAGAKATPSAHSASGCRSIAATLGSGPVSPKACLLASNQARLPDETSQSTLQTTSAVTVIAVADRRSLDVVGSRVPGLSPSCQADHVSSSAGVIPVAACSRLAAPRVGRQTVSPTDSEDEDSGVSGTATAVERLAEIDAQIQALQSPRSGPVALEIVASLRAQLRLVQGELLGNKGGREQRDASVGAVSSAAPPGDLNEETRATASSDSRDCSIDRNHADRGVAHDNQAVRDTDSDEFSDDFLNALASNRRKLRASRPPVTRPPTTQPPAARPTRSAQLPLEGTSSNVAMATGARPAVASLSMSKTQLLRQIRSQKDLHRKEIRHLESELSRLKYKDPLRTCEIAEDEIDIHPNAVLGEGAFARVYRGSYQGQDVAVKRLKVALRAQDRSYFTAEVSLLHELRHPRVVLLLGVSSSGGLPTMVLEYMAGGSLYHHLHQPHSLALDHVVYYQIARDTALGMNYLHRHRPVVLHLDLKSMNVLLTSHLRAKIADFGFSKLRHDADMLDKKKKDTPDQGHMKGTPDQGHMNGTPGEGHMKGTPGEGHMKGTPGEGHMKGTPAWMAPELVIGGEISPKTDVYSYGIILWEMTTRRRPYEGCSVFQVIEKTRTKQRPTIPGDCPAPLSSLIATCWHQNPARRPVFKDVLLRLGDLQFPPEWRALFAAAGVPPAALEDIESARTLVSLVTDNLQYTSCRPDRPDGIPSLTLVDSDEERKRTRTRQGLSDTDSDGEIDTSDSDTSAGDWDTESNQSSGRHGKTSPDQQRAIREKTGSSALRGSVVPAPPPLPPPALHGVPPLDLSDVEGVAPLQRLPHAPEVPPPRGDFMQELRNRFHAVANSCADKVKNEHMVISEQSKIQDHALKVNPADLLQQRQQLKPTDLPHPNQLSDLGTVTREEMEGLAAILRKAVDERRVTLRQDSTDESMTQSGWSVDDV